MPCFFFRLPPPHLPLAVELPCLGPRRTIAARWADRSTSHPTCIRTQGQSSPSVPRFPQCHGESPGLEKTHPKMIATNNLKMKVQQKYKYTTHHEASMYATCHYVLHQLDSQLLWLHRGAFWCSQSTAQVDPGHFPGFFATCSLPWLAQLQGGWHFRYVGLPTPHWEQKTWSKSARSWKFQPTSKEKT